MRNEVNTQHDLRGFSVGISDESVFYVWHWDSLRRYAINTRFYDYQLRSSNNIVTRIRIARQRLGKHDSTMEKLFCMWPAPRPLLCSGAVNTPKTIRDNRRRRFPWGPCKVVIKKNLFEQERVKGRVSGRQSAGIWAWNWIESSLRN
jgi:hypothetical protein